MGLFRKRQVAVLQVEDLIGHLEKLRQTEVNIYEHHNNNDVGKVLEEIKNRSDMIHRDLVNIQEDEKIMESLGDKSDLVKNLLKKYNELIQIVSIQLEELNKSVILLQSESRKQALDGDKIVEHESQFTTKLNELFELLKEQSGVLLSIETEIEEELENHREDLEDNRPEWIKKRFELGKDENGVETIYDNQSGLTWTRKISDNYMNWNQAFEYAEELGNGWRVPSIDEFKKLGGTRKYPLLDELKSYGFLFPIEVKDWPVLWTSDERNTAYAWGVNLYRGNGNILGKTNGYYVSCVR